MRLEEAQKLALLAKPKLQKLLDESYGDNSPKIVNILGADIRQTDVVYKIKKKAKKEENDVSMLAVFMDHKDNIRVDILY